MLFLKLKFKLKHFIVLSVLGIFILFPFRHQIFSIVSDNKQDSSSSLTKHVRSIYNIKSDASNMERINRWNCALSMFKEKPILGFGPGTYQFQYGIFQMYKDKTIISTNSGDMGNAHSEYLGALSETGVIGLGLLLLFITIISTANSIITIIITIIVTRIIVAMNTIIITVITIITISITVIIIIVLLN